MNDWVNELSRHAELIAVGDISIEEFSNRFTTTFHNQRVLLGTALHHLATDIYVLIKYHFEISNLDNMTFSRRLSSILNKYVVVEHSGGEVANA